MKVYELIEKLMMIPAGCEVDFYDGAGTIYAVNNVNAPSDCASRDPDARRRFGRSR